MPTYGGYGQYEIPTYGGYGQYGVPTYGGYGQYGVPTYGGYSQFGVPTYGEYGQSPAYGGYSDYKEPKPELHTGCPDICPLNHDPVCGSDGETYANDCALTVWKCNHGPSDLKIVHGGKCGYGNPTYGPPPSYGGYKPQNSYPGY